MPLIIVTGYPSSGKSTIVDRLVERFKKDKKVVHVIRDEDYGSFSTNIYDFTDKEKNLRSWIRSEVQRNLTKNTIVICDSLNYIKGYRYELFLTAKMSKTTYCVLQVTPSANTCKWLNSQKAQDLRYSNEQIDNLIMRYEMPESKFRWEKPLFEVNVGQSDKCVDELNKKEEIDMMIDLDHPSPKFSYIFDNEIFDWIINGVELKENQSTQVVPLAPTNFLQELDRVTQDVISVLLEAQRTAVVGQNISIAGTSGDSYQIKYSKTRSLPELNRLRRQFINISKKDPTCDKIKITDMFVNFLSNNLR